MLQLKDLRVSQWDKPYIRLTQENSIENSVQDCLPYISKTNGLCSTTLVYPKLPCVCFKVNIYIIYCITSFLSEYSTIFHCDMWSCDITLTLILSS